MTASDDTIIAFDLRSQALPLAYIFATETKLPQLPRHTKQASAFTRPTSVVEDAGDAEQVISHGSAHEFFCLRGAVERNHEALRRDLSPVIVLSETVRAQPQTPLLHRRHLQLKGLALSLSTIPVRQINRHVDVAVSHLPLHALLPSAAPEASDMTSLDTNDVGVNDRSCPLAFKAASCRGPAPIAGQQVTRGVYPTDAEALTGRPHSAQPMSYLPAIEKPDSWFLPRA
ncbi:hypothetical protein GGG16DRAFT_113875 [Schizophyllum commune]